jgi:Holliday junction resolvase-like predicted endonuclease
LKSDLKDLTSALTRRCGSRDAADEALRNASWGLGVGNGQEQVLAAVALIAMGAPVEEVSGGLSWQDFERFCGRILRAWGFSVSENVTFTKPRAQIDLIARSSSLAIAVDCKHWRRERSYAALEKVAEAQKARARMARARIPSLEPLAVAVFVLSNEQVRFLNGAAVVPISTLVDFLSGLPVYSGNLAFF